MQPEAREPKDRDVDLSLAHQPPIMNDAQQESGKHQPHRRFRIDARLARAIGGVAAMDVGAQPGQVQHAANPGEDMVVGQQLAQ